MIPFQALTAAGKAAHVRKELIYCCRQSQRLYYEINHVFGEITHRNYTNKPAKHGSANEALRSFCRMDGFGVKHTKFDLCTALNHCAKTLNSHMGLQIHARIIQTGYQDNLFMNSALVDVYAKCGALVDAMRVFNNLKEHDEVSWTSIISGFSQNGRGKDAVLLFKEMLRTQVKPNCFTYVGLISACTGIERALIILSQLHTHVIKLGCASNSFVVSSLIDCYSKCGYIGQAILLFDATTERDNILLNSMISGYSQNRCGEEALALFIDMWNRNLHPTDHTLSSVLNACASLTVLQQGRQVHTLAIKMASNNNVFVVCALVDMYSKCGDVDEARLVFNEMDRKNNILWTSMITGYAQSGRGSEGLELFDNSVAQGFLPDHVCFTAVLTACNHAGFLDRGVEYFNKMRKTYDLVPELDQYACLIDLYARNGHLRKARELMEDMPFEANSIMWSSFLSSCKVYGEIEFGKEAAHKLFEMDPQNAVPYITLANIYAGAGLWGEVAEIRQLMNKRRKRKSAGRSWVQIDNKCNSFSVG